MLCIVSCLLTKPPILRALRKKNITFQNIFIYSWVKWVEICIHPTFYYYHVFGVFLGEVSKTRGKTHRPDTSATTGVMAPPKGGELILGSLDGAIAKTSWFQLIWKMIHPGRLTWNIIIGVWRSCSFLNGWFVCSMLIFQGVCSSNWIIIFRDKFDKNTKSLKQPSRRCIFYYTPKN